MVTSDAANLLDQLWDHAYDELKIKETKLVDTYEKILSCELKKSDSNSVTSTSYENAIEQTNLAITDGRARPDGSTENRERG